MAKPASNHDPLQVLVFCPNPHCQFHNPEDASKSAWFIKREKVRADQEANMVNAKMLIVFGHHTFRKPFKINNILDIDAQETHADKVHLMESRDAKNAFKRLYTHRHVWSHQKTKSLWCEQIWQMKIHRL